MTYYLRLQCSPLTLVLMLAWSGVNVLGFRVRETVRQHKDAHKSLHLEHKGQGLANSSKGNSSKGALNQAEMKGPDTPAKKGKEEKRPLPPYHMKENTGLQEQGFKGKDVEHNDMKTVASDWRKEYGPSHPNYQTMAEICKNYPKNPYCLDYLPTEAPLKAPRIVKSTAEGTAISLLMYVSLLVHFL